MATFTRWVWYCKKMMAAKGSLVLVIPWILLRTVHVAKCFGLCLLNINVNTVIKRDVTANTEKLKHTKSRLRFGMSWGALLNNMLSDKALVVALAWSCCDLCSHQEPGLICWLIEAFESGYGASLYSIVQLLLCCFQRMPTVCLPANTSLTFVFCPCVFTVCIIGK